MNNYPLNCEAIRSRILGRFPESRSIKNEADNIGYALWMLEQIPHIDTQGKIDRWIGCVQGIVHTLQLFTWDEIRALTREDLHP